MNKKYNNLIAILTCFFVFLFIVDVSGVSNYRSIANNVKLEIRYNPNSNRELYVFHDYGSSLPYDNAKFDVRAKGYNKSTVMVGYANAIGDNQIVRISDTQYEGREARLVVNQNYDYFKSGSYGIADGDGNRYSISIK